MKILLIFTLLLTTNPLYAQIEGLLHPMTFPVMVNPAFAGTTEHARITLSGMQRWSRFLSATNDAWIGSHDQHFDQLGGGLGFFASYHRWPFDKHSTVGGMYNYRISFSDKMAMRIGVKANYFESTIPDETLSSHLRYLETHESYINWGTGILFYKNTFYGGLSVDNLFRPILRTFSGDNPQPRVFRFQGGYWHKLSSGDKSWVINPSVLLEKKSTNWKILTGIQAHKGWFTGGVFLEEGSMEAIYLLTGIQKGVIRISYHYEFPISNNYVFASHQLALTLLLNQNKTDLGGQMFSRVF
ncbi:MAG: PorP/SprF family type IX secretion system membrane protein [Bacteroidia bacterium]